MGSTVLAQEGLAHHFQQEGQVLLVDRLLEGLGVDGDRLRARAVAAAAVVEHPAVRGLAHYEPDVEAVLLLAPARRGVGDVSD